MIPEKYASLKLLTTLAEGADRTAAIEQLLAGEADAPLIPSGVNVALFPFSAEPVIRSTRTPLDMWEFVRDFLQHTPLAWLDEMRRQGNFATALFTALEERYLANPLPEEGPPRFVILFNNRAFPDLTVRDQVAEARGRDAFIARKAGEMGVGEVVRAGTIITVTSGDWSDYEIDGVFRAVRDIDLNKLRIEYLCIHPEQAQSYRFRKEQFLAWLFTRGFLEDCDWRELRMGYSDIWNVKWEGGGVTDWEKKEEEWREEEAWEMIDSEGRGEEE